jgi:hypothetical protein
VARDLAEAKPRLQRLTEALGSRSVSLVYQREAKLNDAARTVIHFVVEVMKRRPAPRARPPQH